MDIYEENAIDELITRADKSRTTLTPDGDYGVKGLYIPDAKFTQLAFYTDSAPNSLRDVFSLQMLIHTTQHYANDQNSTSFNAELFSFCKTEIIDAKTLETLNLALAQAYNTASFSDKNGLAIKPTVALKVIDELDNIFATFQ